MFGKLAPSDYGRGAALLVKCAVLLIILVPQLQ